ncbi:hypothetical protein FPOAC2_13936 [Fusarium poae]|uniref:Uncharacterized protein n=1 Tax=Fusarium poae TaxID=36050 RepID=A0A1B8A4M9_FUSPO|nr:hypothetical protein FPOA_13705 [Fusarium poae]
MEAKHNPSHRKSHRIITPPERKTLPSPPASGERDQAPGASTETSSSFSSLSETADELPENLLTLKKKLLGVREHSSVATAKLSNEDYERCYDKIQATFRRFDYLFQKELIIIRMPSPIHEFFIWKLGIAIHEKLRDLGRQNKQVSSFTNKIDNGLSGHIELLDQNGDEVLKRMPDIQFQFAGAEYPGVVAEVALTQDVKQLGKIAKEYIHYSWAAIQVVICVDLNTDKESTISVWKPAYTPIPGTGEKELSYKEVVKREPFRTADGNPVNQGSLTLHLHDFVTEEFRQGISNLSFSIPYSEMAEMLNSSQRIHEGRNVAAKRKRPIPRGVKRRSASLESEPEEMIDQDKARYDNEAAAAMKKLDTQDETYEDVEGEEEERPAKKRAQLARDCAST